MAKDNFFYFPAKFLFLLALNYFIFAAIAWQWNPMTWEPWQRMVIVLGCILATALTETDKK